MKKILGSVALAGIPLLFALGAFTPVVASAHTGLDFKIAWHHFFNWSGHGNNNDNGKGALIVIKRTMTGNGTFQMSGDNGAGSFSVTTHWHFGAKVLKNLTAGTYHITEATQSGWSTILNTCSTVTVKAHHTAFCIVVNKQSTADNEPTTTGSTGTLTITKTAVGAPDGTAFTFAVNGTIPDITVTVHSGTGVTNTTVPVGTYTVVENETPGWTEDTNASQDCTAIVVSTDAPGTCSVTNVADSVTPVTPSQTGGLTINKSVEGGTGSFLFDVAIVGNSTMQIPVGPVTDGTTAIQDVYSVPVGQLTITEEANAVNGWLNGDINCVPANAIVAGATTTCSVTNTFTPPSVDPTPAPQVISGGGGGSNGPPASGGGGGGSGWTFNFPQVLGASSTTLPELPPGCTALLSNFLRKGKPNNTDEVKKLQQFLNDELGLKLPITGFFGTLTDKGVRQFQLIHKPQVLTPWGITDPTGYVYKTTMRWINLSSCSSLDIPMPELN